MAPTKRRAASEEDDSQSTPTSKRARTIDSDDGGVPRRESKSDVGKKDKPRRRDDDSGDESGIDEEEIAEQEEFERAFGQRYINQIKNKNQRTGGIAEMGIIESVEMVNFMCHKFLTFNFGPQVNFIIGHNGSGKSAVLSAITIALGGKAISTGRGNGIKSFIKEGQNRAEVTLSLKNRGEEAYKPELYGDLIVIRRQWSKDGSGSWRIMSKKGETIAQKREELSAITDHMNIQVDNPMNVLTQDSARQFLSASTGTDKYNFFLRGTQLSQLSTEYDTCLENIRNTTKILATKKEAIPDLRTAHNEATARFEEAAKALEQKKRVGELKKELAWSHVSVKEEELKVGIRDATKVQGKIAKIQSSLTETERKVVTASEEVQKHEDKYTTLGDMDELEAKRLEVKAEISANKKRITDFTSDIHAMNDNLKGLNKQIAEYEKEIAVEARRLEADSQAKHEAAKRELDNARTAKADAHTLIQELAGKYREAMAEADGIKAEGEAMESDLAHLKKNIDHCNNMIRDVERSTHDHLIAFGNEMPKVLDRIAKTRWFGDKPIGPLGLHVKVKEPEKWAEVLRRMLIGSLTAFAVTDARDRDTLKKIFQETKNHNLTIIIYEKDLFDYSRGEPRADYLTVLRALEVSDPYVERIMINQARIERIFLAVQRIEGEAVLREQPSGAGTSTCWTADGHNLRRFPEGGESVQPLAPPRNDASSRLLNSRDAAAEKSDWQRKLSEYETEFRTKKQECSRLQGNYSVAKRRGIALQAEEKKAHEDIRKANSLISRLQEEVNSFVSASAAGLQGAKEEVTTEKESLLSQIRDVMEQKKAVGDANAILLAEYNDYKTRLDDFEGIRKKVSTEIEVAVETRLKAQNDVKHWKVKLAEEKGRLEHAEDVVKALEKEFETWTTSAAKYCERVETNRLPQVIQTQIDAAQKALTEREKRQGATVEELIVEVNRTKANLEAVERDLKQMVKLNKLLRASVVTRYARWQEFRRHIALRTKMVFQYNLSHRGYLGKLVFDHKKAKLELKVRTDDQHGRDKDPKSLSGGEKSFSTICLLLSLWESIGCPLRCLDEFDVFMDAINRRISMKMMIESANQSDKKQYVLITPQDMTNIHIQSSVKVHRMTDPERNQGTLAFA